MKGAAEYADALDRGEHRVGKLKIWFGSHARGKTLQIWVIGNNGDEVMVYGVINGQPGWTEEYGWLHRGPWEKDFHDFVSKQRAEKSAKNAAWEAEQLAAKNRVSEKQRDILASY